MDKKAISPVVATVLLIVIAVSLFGIVYLWSRAFVQEHVLKFGESARALCQQVQFDADVSVDNGALHIVLNNVGNVNIYKIQVKFVGQGITKTAVYDAGGEEGFALSAGNVAEIVVQPPQGTSFDNIVKIVITPILLGEGQKTGNYKEYLCEGYEREFFVS